MFLIVWGQIIQYGTSRGKSTAPGFSGHQGPLCGNSDALVVLGELVGEFYEPRMNSTVKH